VGVVAKFFLALAAAAVVFLVVTPTGRYLLRAGTEEARILARRIPIDRLVQDSTVDAATRDKLRLVQAARRFAVDSLGLTADASFTTYSYVDSDTLVLVVSAAYRDRLAMRTRWWPVVGRVPYQGYFDFAAAHRERDALEAAGFDAEIRPASAFSTLGWFNDPLLNTTLRADSTDLVETVLHEMVHSTVWIPGDAVFNESFANFVGVHGAAWFFRARGDSAAVARVMRGWSQERILGDFYQRTYESLRDAFDARPGDSLRAARLAVRDSVFAVARQRLADSVGPALGVTDTAWATGLRLNNATVMARRVYRTGLPWFDAVLQRHEGDLRAAWQQIAKVALEAPQGGAYAAVDALAR